jgi:hypothetical protein
MVLCRKFPGSRWHIFRKDLPTLKATTIPSFEKLAPHYVRVSREPGNFHAQFPNGSTIFFRPENITHDPELKDLLGLETNGIFIEQAEEASRNLWEKAIERAGSWYIDPMPPALTFLTFNPTNEWPRDVFYTRYIDGTLPESFFYMPALPKDNPFVTKDQWEAWNQMDSRMYSAMIMGDWDALINQDGRAFWTFSKQKNVQSVPFLPEIPVCHLSFDQNVVPYITMLACQCMYKENGVLQIRIFKEYCLRHPRNKTQAVCEAWAMDFGEHTKEVFIYGDASGNRRDTRAAQSDYDIAISTLRRWTSSRSKRVQRTNPEVRKRVLFICAIFEGKIPDVEIIIDTGCTNLVQDLLMVKEDANGGKVKERGTENGVSFERYGHTSDALEYLVTSILPREFRDFERLIS